MLVVKFGVVSNAVGVLAFFSAGDYYKLALSLAVLVMAVIIIITGSYIARYPCLPQGSLRFT
jgi:hypothetical protein